jgi:DNA modification methylase
MTQLQVQAFPVGQLRTYHRNPRRGAVAKIAESLKVRGQYRPLVVNVGTHTGRPFEVLAGNHTLAAAISLGWSTVEATTVDVDDEGAAQIVLADNRLADLGTYDEADLLEVLQAAGDLAGTGYDDRDLARLVASLEEPVGLTDPDDAPPLPSGSPISRPGDVWHLGPHRLVVGSSGELDAVEAAAQGVVDCVWTDPPYGVEYVGKTADALRIQNDGAAGALEVFADSLVTCLAVARPGAPIYVAHADRLRVEFQGALEAAGISVRQTLIWVKDSMVLSRADYHYRSEPILEGSLPAPAPEVDSGPDYEPVMYGFTPGGEGRLGRGGPHWHGDNRATTVLEVPRPKASRVHPTMKPPQLIELMLRNSCPPGGLVFDPFAGSGSTMIACHRLGMRALLVELDPGYADVICRRWEEHTGVVPVRDGEPVTFAGGS